MVVKCLYRQAAVLVCQLTDTLEIKMWITGTCVLHIGADRSQLTHGTLEVSV